VIDLYFILFFTEYASWAAKCELFFIHLNFLFM
jgi:hypothetical protein